jgi:hypothetical protein
MDERDKAEEQVEDLEAPESEAEEVKGGFSWGVTQTGSLKQADGSVRPGNIRGVDGGQVQHNETLVRI